MKSLGFHTSNLSTSKSKIQQAGLKLCLALMLGLLVVPGYVMAPILFAELSSSQAGLIAGKVFHISNIAILILACAAMAFCYRIQVTKATWYLLIAVSVLVVANAFGVSTMIAMIKSEAGDISALSPDEPLRWAFAFWHGMGSILHLISTILLVLLVMKSKTAKSAELVET